MTSFQQAMMASLRRHKGRARQRDIYHDLRSQGIECTRHKIYKNAKFMATRGELICSCPGTYFTPFRWYDTAPEDQLTYALCESRIQAAIQVFLWKRDSHTAMINIISRNCFDEGKQLPPNSVPQHLRKLWRKGILEKPRRGFYKLSKERILYIRDLLASPLFGSVPRS